MNDSSFIRAINSVPLPSLLKLHELLQDSIEESDVLQRQLQGDCLVAQEAEDAGEVALLSGRPPRCPTTPTATAPWQRCNHLVVLGRSPCLLVSHSRSVLGQQLNVEAAAVSG